MLTGLAGVVIRRTRSAAGALAWAAAAVLIVLPVAEHEYTYRYVIPAVPLACLAAALTTRNRAGDAGSARHIGATAASGRPAAPE